MCEGRKRRCVSSHNTKKLCMDNTSWAVIKSPKGFCLVNHTMHWLLSHNMNVAKHSVIVTIRLEQRSRLTMSSSPSGIREVTVSLSCRFVIQARTPSVNSCSRLIGSQSNMQSYSKTYSSFSSWRFGGVRNVCTFAGSAKIPAAAASKAAMANTLAVCIAAAYAFAAHWRLQALPEDAERGDTVPPGDDGQSNNSFLGK